MIGIYVNNFWNTSLKFSFMIIRIVNTTSESGLFRLHILIQLDLSVKIKKYFAYAQYEILKIYLTLNVHYREL